MWVFSRHGEPIDKSKQIALEKESPESSPSETQYKESAMQYNGVVFEYSGANVTSDI